MREYAIKFRDNTIFVSIDDKAKVDFGEPGLYVSSGVRGKKSMLAINRVCYLDHDMQSKGSLTPSLILC